MREWRVKPCSHRSIRVLLSTTKNTLPRKPTKNTPDASQAPKAFRGSVVPKSRATHKLSAKKITKTREQTAATTRKAGVYSTTASPLSWSVRACCAAWRCSAQPTPPTRSIAAKLPMISKMRPSEIRVSNIFLYHYAASSLLGARKATTHLAMVGLARQMALA